MDEWTKAINKYRWKKLLLVDYPPEFEIDFYQKIQNNDQKATDEACATNKKKQKTKTWLMKQNLMSQLKI